MRISGVQGYGSFVSFGTINKADKERAIKTGFDKKEVEQAEKMKYFN